MASRSVSLLAAAGFVLLCPIADAAPRGDANGDGRLSLTEFQTMSQKRFARADKDGDGKVSLEEWTARSKAKANKDPSKQFSRLDANKDGQLDMTEIEALVKRRFASLDKNSDGAITPEERPAREAADTDPDEAAVDDDGEAPESEHTKRPVN